MFMAGGIALEEGKPTATNFLILPCLAWQKRSLDILCARPVLQLTVIVFLHILPTAHYDIRRTEEGTSPDGKKTAAKLATKWISFESSHY
jgi:hypothetical protein